MGVAFLRRNKKRKKKAAGGKLLVTFAAIAGDNILHLYEGIDMFDCNIDWGDGVVTACPADGGEITHNYAVAKTYVIEIVGFKFGWFRVNGASGSEKYIKIELDTSYGNFDQTERVEFSNCFYGCYRLTEIPAGLFDNCVEVTDFSDCFRGCDNLTTIPAGLFDNCVEVTYFYNCFYGCQSLTSAVPALWQRTNPTPNGNYCYRSCTSAANYDEIPADWK